MKKEKCEHEWGNFHPVSKDEYFFLIVKCKKCKSQGSTDLIDLKVTVD